MPADVTGITQGKGRFPKSAYWRGLFTASLTKTLAPLASIFVLAVIWYLVVKAFSIPEYLMPSPDVVAKELAGNLSGYLRHAWRTTLEAAAGFALGNVTALITGLVLFHFVRLRQLTLPVITALQAIPIVALAPLFVVWLGSGFLSKALMAATISYFPTLAAILSSFSEVDADTQDFFRLYRARYLTTVRCLLIPASLPAIANGLKVSAGLATVGAIVAEMTGADMGIGYLILNASYRMETVKMFVGIILAGLLGMVAYSLPGLIRYVYPWAWAATRAEGK